MTVLRFPSQRDGGPDPFELARRTPCQLLVGAVQLRKQSGRLVGPCPLCGGDDKSSRFSVEVRKNLFYCFACQTGGGPVELEQALRGGSRREAAVRAAGLVAELSRPEPRRATPATPAQPAPSVATPRPPVSPLRSFSAAVAARVWGEARPATGSLVEAWLTARGLDPRGLPGALERLRFHPRAPAGGGQGWSVSAPALVAPLTSRASGVAKVVGVHLTYLSADGRSKARLTDPDGSPLPARKVWGQVKGAAVELTDLGPANPGPLCVGEGVETVWAVAQQLALAGQPVRAAATCNLGNLQGGWLKDRWGRVDLDSPRADPEHPPWLLADAGSVLVLVDHDSSPVRARARGFFRGTREVELSSTDRARVCASLARQAWLRAGASEVVCLAPPPGQDFNDLLLADETLGG